MSKDDKINNLVTNAMELAKSDDKKGLRKLLSDLDNIYFSQGSLTKDAIPDSIYDKILSLYEDKFGEISTVGHRGSTEDVKLERYLGSLDKIKTTDKEPEKKLKRWLDKNPEPYLLEAKADGVSAYIIKNAKKPVQIFTRGDGKFGKDISHFREVLVGNRLDDFVGELRGEIVIGKKAWEKFGKGYAVARNMVTGILGQKTPNKKIVKALTLVLYEVMSVNKKSRKDTMYDQLLFAEKLGFPVVTYLQVKLKSQITIPFLTEELKKMRKKTPYEIDGLVVFSDKTPHRVNESGNPGWGIAFKDDEMQANVEVVGVEYKTSKNGALKPTVIFKPVVLGGATHRRATAFNANFIKENKIGPGSKLLVIKSGDVIPYILKIISKTIPDLPDNAMKPKPEFHYKGHKSQKYVWGDGSRLRSTLDAFTEDSQGQDIANITAFFAKSGGLNIKGISEKTISKIYEAGLKDISKILHASKEDLEEAGMGPKQADNLVTAIRKKFEQPLSLALLVSASPIFTGLKLKTAKAIFLNNEDALTNETLRRPAHVSQETVDEFKNKRKDFLSFLKKNPQIQVKVVVVSPVRRDGILNGSTLVFTGTLPADKAGNKVTREDAQEFAKDNGANVDSSVKQSTTHLVIGDEDYTKYENEGTMSSKLKKAVKLKKKIMSGSMFLKKIGKL